MIMDLPLSFQWMPDIDNERFRKLLLAYPARALELLYERYYRILLKISHGLTHDQNASEDIVQETFAHIWEKHKVLGKHHDRSILYYLIRVVKYKSITHYERSQRFKKFKLNVVNGKSFPATENSIEVSVIQGEIRQEIRRTIDSFPKREKECLILKMDEEMTIAQIANRLNISTKAVERSLTSANKRFRRLWTERI